MSGEPKTLTPHEALRLLRERGMELAFDSNDATPWAVYRNDSEYPNEYLHFGQTEEEVLSVALGVPVVARDEASELRGKLLPALGMAHVRLLARGGPAFALDVLRDLYRIAEGES